MILLLICCFLGFNWAYRRNLMFVYDNVVTYICFSKKATSFEFGRFKIKELLRLDFVVFIEALHSHQDKYVVESLLKFNFIVALLLEGYNFLGMLGNF